jgi:hypothetical protein
MSKGENSGTTRFLQSVVTLVIYSFLLVDAGSFRFSYTWGPPLHLYHLLGCQEDSVRYDWVVDHVADLFHTTN